MDLGSKNCKKPGNSMSQPIRSEYAQICAGDDIRKNYIVPFDKYEDDEGGHAVREAFVYTLGIPGCLPCSISWALREKHLEVSFRMPRAPCTLRDILMNRVPFEGYYWKKMPPTRRLQFADRVCKDLLFPLAHLSSKGIIHQDLHDANVVLYENRFCPIDFGFAMFYDPEVRRRSDLNQWCPPPERVGEDSPVPLSFDTWSLGTIFTMCLVGNMPTYSNGDWLRNGWVLI